MSMKNLLANEIILFGIHFLICPPQKSGLLLLSVRRMFLRIFLLFRSLAKQLILLDGEFVLEHWKSSGLNVPSAVKRGIYTITKDLVIKSLGKLHPDDAFCLHESIRLWLC